MEKNEDLMFRTGIPEDEDFCGLLWAGKKESARKAETPTTVQPVFRPEASVRPVQTENLYLEGDSLDALKLMQKSCQGSIRLVYIDPPYNTGNEFIFRDSFLPEGPPDSPCRANRQGSRKSVRSHAAWCSMMYPRLVLARELLTEDGLLFISIDDNELANLRKICDEIFGEENYINLITVKSKASSGASGGGEDRRLKKNTEYLCIYARSRRHMRMRQPEKRIPLSDYRREHKVNKTGFYYTRILEFPGEKKLLEDSDGIRIYERKNFRFSTVKAKMAEEHLTEEEVYSKYFERIFMVTNAQTSLLQKANRAAPHRKALVSYEYTPKTGKNRGYPSEKFVWNGTLIVWLADSAEKSGGIVYKKEKTGTLWDDISWGRLDLQGGVPFKNGKKPLKLLDRILHMASDKDSTVLDFFSGSATTAHAVMQLNAEDGGRRKFIMVQLPEACGRHDAKDRAGFRTICEIGEERIRRAGDQILETFSGAAGQMEFEKEKPLPPDVGFRVFRLTENMKQTKEDLDFLFRALFLCGLPLSLPVESLSAGEFPLYFAGNSFMAACPCPHPDQAVFSALAERSPKYAAFSKSASDAKTAFALLSPETRVVLL